MIAKYSEKNKIYMTKFHISTKIDEIPKKIAKHCDWLGKYLMRIKLVLSVLSIEKQTPNTVVCHFECILRIITLSTVSILLFRLNTTAATASHFFSRVKTDLSHSTCNLVSRLFFPLSAKISCELIFASAAALWHAFAFNSILVCVYLVVNRIISDVATRAADNHISVRFFFLFVCVCARGFSQCIRILLI